MVTLACERPDVVGRSLSQWESAALARQVVHDGVMEAISPQTVQRMLAHHTLKPWRHPLWLSPQVPRDAAFAAQVHDIERRNLLPYRIEYTRMAIGHLRQLIARQRSSVLDTVDEQLTHEPTTETRNRKEMIPNE